MFPDKMLEFLDTWSTDNLKFNDTGEKIKYTLKVKQSDWLRICLVWTDPPGNSIKNNLNLIFENYEVRTNKRIANDFGPITLRTWMPTIMSK